VAKDFAQPYMAVYRKRAIKTQTHSCLCHAPAVKR